uniref:Corticotropin-releasing factor domain-containing protein n=1 Tax=Ascaris lumbricoides TaxID=6252 RepID=A0A0M3I1G5_ASCLU
MVIAQILFAIAISSPVMCFLEPLPSLIDTSEGNAATSTTLQQPKFFSIAPYLRYVNAFRENQLEIIALNLLEHLNDNLGNMNARVIYSIPKHFDDDPTWKMMDIDQQQMNINRRSLSRFIGASNEKRNALQRLAMNGARGFGRK